MPWQPLTVVVIFFLLNFDLPRLGRLGVGDHVERRHPVDHHVAPLQTGGRVLHRVVGRRVLHQTGQHGRLRQGELRRRGAEVVLGGDLDAVRAVAVVGDVQVALEDLVLAERLLHRDRVTELADLAAVAVVLRGRDARVVTGLLGLLDLDHLDVLLRQGGATLGDPTGDHVGQEGAQGADGVQGPVLVEPVVLDRDDRLLHHRGDVGQRHVDAVLVVEVREHVAVHVQHLGALALGRLVEGGRQIVERPLRGLAGEHRGAHGGQRDDGDQQPAQGADHQEQPAGAQASEASGTGGSGRVISGVTADVRSGGTVQGEKGHRQAQLPATPDRSRHPWVSLLTPLVRDPRSLAASRA